MVLCVSDAANAEGEKGAMKFRWQRKPLGMSIDCGGRGEGGGDEGLARTRSGFKLPRSTLSTLLTLLTLKTRRATKLNSVPPSRLR